MYLHFEHLCLTLKLSVMLKMVKLLVVVRQKSLKGPALEMASHPDQVREVGVEGEGEQEPLAMVVVVGPCSLQVMSWRHELEEEMTFFLMKGLEGVVVQYLAY